MRGGKGFRSTAKQQLHINGYEDQRKGEKGGVSQVQQKSSDCGVMETNRASALGHGNGVFQGSVEEIQ